MERLFLILAVVFLSSCSQDKETVEKVKPKVSVIEVKKQDVEVSFDFVATTQSSREVDIQARVSGFLEERVYTEGDFVKEGQTLFVMDKKPFEAQVSAAKAALEARKAVKETAKLNLERTRPLAKLNALSQKDLDDAIGQYDSATAGVHEAEANLITAELNLSYCTISSPLDGITSSAKEQDGAYLNMTNNLLTTVSRLNPIWVNFSISEIQMQNLRNEFKQGTLIKPSNGEYEVEVILIDGKAFPHTGKITFTEPYFNSQTSTFLIRATVKNPQNILRPHQFVTARVKGLLRPNAILVPQRAVKRSAKGHYVWVVSEKGAVEFRPVEMGQWYSQGWFINQGLFQGDQVVVDGDQGLVAGESVDVKIFHP